MSHRYLKNVTQEMVRQNLNGVTLNFKSITSKFLQHHIKACTASHYDS